MKTSVSTAFVYAVLCGILSVLLFVYYQKNTNKKYEKSKSIYNIGIFCLVANIVYFSIINNGNSDLEFERPVFISNLEMKTGQPCF
tara:strand:+ start:7374 stop:7631 length:258 start_codon:yes stop_codon:yes gene_type:complete